MSAYENQMSIEALRRELRECWDLQGDIIKALKDLPETVPYSVQVFLSEGAKWPDDSTVGKELQRIHRSAIPFKSECETGSGLWHHIRAGILAARKQDHPTNG